MGCSWCVCYKTDYSNIDVEKDGPQIKSALDRLRILSMAIIALGCLLMVDGIIIVSIIGSYSSFPSTSGSQIWSGAVTVAAGAIAFRATTIDVNNLDSLKRVTCLISNFYWLCTSMQSVNGISTGYSISGVVVCSNNTCSEYNSLMIALYGVGIGLGTLSIICAILGMMYFYRCRRTFGIMRTNEKCNIASEKQGYTVS